MKVFTVLVLAASLLSGGEPTIGPYVTFLKKSFSAPQNLKYSNAVIFDRNQGEANREWYRRAFGNGGQLLVEAYGRGLSKEELLSMGYL